jgi:hypothetical protein
MRDANADSIFDMVIKFNREMKLPGAGGRITETEGKVYRLTWRLLVQLFFKTARPNNKQICL